MNTVNWWYAKDKKSWIESTLASKAKSFLAWVIPNARLALRSKLPSDIELRISSKTTTDAYISKITFTWDESVDINMLSSKIEQYEFSLQDFIEYIYKHIKNNDIEKYINILVGICDSKIDLWDNISSKYKFNENLILGLWDKINKSELPITLKEHFANLYTDREYSILYKKNPNSKSTKTIIGAMIWATLIGWVAIKQITKNNQKTHIETIDNTYIVKKWDTLWSIAKENWLTVPELQEINWLKGNNINTWDQIKTK